MWLIVSLLLWPLIEIALFVTIGGRIGLLATLAIILGTAALGFWIMRSEGMRSAADLRASFDRMQSAAPSLAAGVMRMLAALLLVLPGFLTDMIGVLLLIPPVQTLIFIWLARNMRSLRPQGPVDPFRDPTRSDVIIDGEYHEMDAAKRPTHTPSGWTRH